MISAGAAAANVVVMTKTDQDRPKQTKTLQESKEPVVQRFGGEWVLQQGSSICGPGLRGFLVCGHHRPHLITPCLQARNHIVTLVATHPCVELCLGLPFFHPSAWWHFIELQILSTVACTDVKFVGGLLFHILNVFFSFPFLQCIGG